MQTQRTHSCTQWGEEGGDAWTVSTRVSRGRRCGRQGGRAGGRCYGSASRRPNPAGPRGCPARSPLQGCSVSGGAAQGPELAARCRPGSFSKARLLSWLTGSAPLDWDLGVCSSSPSDSPARDHPAETYLQWTSLGRPGPASLSWLGSQVQIHLCT